MFYFRRIVRVLKYTGKIPVNHFYFLPYVSYSSGFSESFFMVFEHLIAIFLIFFTTSCIMFIVFRNY